jgi:hypothetical protein
MWMSLPRQRDLVSGRSFKNVHNMDVFIDECLA